MNNNNIEKDMQHPNRKYNKPLYYLITLIICLAIAVPYAISTFKTYASPQKEFVEYCVAISDGCFFAGVLVGGIGILVYISGEGYFDMIVYGVSIILKAFSKKNTESESFYDYKQRRVSERGDAKIWFVAVVGLAFVLIAILFSIPSMI